MTNPQGDAAVKHNAVLHAHEALTTLCEWFGQREAGQPTTNSEAAIFARCSQAADYLDAALGLALDTRPSQPQGACVQVEGLRAKAERCVPGSTEWRTPTMSVAPATVLAILDRLAQVEADRDQWKLRAEAETLRADGLASKRDQHQIVSEYREGAWKAALHQRDAARKALEEIRRNLFNAGNNRALTAALTIADQALSDLKDANDGK